MGIQTLEILHFSIQKVESKSYKTLQVGSLHAVNFLVNQFFLQHTLPDVKYYICQLGDSIFLGLRVLSVWIDGVYHCAIRESLDELLLDPDIKFLKKTRELR